jgi:CheY-like chemotaxis protein
VGEHWKERRQVVLVVEDEPLLRMMAVDMVEDAGFEAVEAADATDAVRILERRTDIRIVFTDIDMPRGMDGMRLAAAIRDRWPPIEIILTSGHVAVDDVRMPPRSVFFPKPYVVEKVVETLHRMAG